ncbi:MAG: serine/threonine protein kinase [Acidobacteria bacterium]|nr:serine/threonine protein kinase [Acidobacteriota bacterium]
MLKCLTCGKEVAGGSLSCPSCGAALDPSLVPTRLRPGDAPGTGRRSLSGAAAHTSTSPESIDDARFVPGVVLGGRYRIVGLLGRGGMGEVYRAEDLTLRQTVALKFLPESVAGDGAALERFRREVRIARQISHPNVCRVYDIVEAEGLHFLSMEFIKGEELASVLKRFGRLPEDKGLALARQICAGLAAAHKGGVLHRDLKPANVMIDEAGDARVTDFGLAALAEELRGDERSGTPAYMSPEQLAGRELTPRSDIYSLGLVLYELFTGRRAFDARTVAEVVRRRRTDATPSSPSSHFKNLDPLVERVIMRCLETDPARRPASALEVAAAMPGRDPLAVALAAGETPTPEMVAAAPKQGGLKPAAAAALLAVVVVGLGVMLWLSGRVLVNGWVALDKPPEVLRERAAGLARGFGYDEPPVDSWYDLSPFEIDYLGYVRQHDRSPARWSRLKTGTPPVVYFRYRQSPRYLVPRSRSAVTPDDPPPEVAGMLSLSLDTRGRLASLRAVPPQVDEGGAAGQPPDWAAAFSAAGLDPSGFKTARSQYTPPDAYDAREAWEGAFPEQPDIPIRVEAAGYRGRLTYFEIVRPWDRPRRQGEYESASREWLAQALGVGLLLLVLFGAFLLARRNLRLGRGDRRGAFRLALFISLCAFARRILLAHHVPGFAETDLFLTGWLPDALAKGGISWLLYVALEPLVRRRWAGLLISWNRLLAGDWRDPLVGRDVLIGAAAGTAITVTDFCYFLAPGWLGLPPERPSLPAPEAFLGFRGLMGYGADALLGAVMPCLTLLFVALLLAGVLRKDWLVAVAGWLLVGLLIYAGRPLAFSYLSLEWLFALLEAALFVYVYARHGALAAMSTLFSAIILRVAPLTTDLSLWYAANGLSILLAGLALALYGFHTSLAGQPLFGGDVLGIEE